MVTREIEIGQCSRDRGTTVPTYEDGLAKPMR